MASTSEIAQILSATLNPDTNTRIAAELKLAESFADFSTCFYRDGLQKKLTRDEIPVWHWRRLFSLRMSIFP